MIIEVFRKQFVRFFLKNAQKLIKSFPENDKCVSNDDELRQIFCGYFSNVIPDLQIPSMSKNISNVTNVADLILAAINMFQGHPSVKNKIIKMNAKIIKMNANIFANFIYIHFNYCIDIGEFPQAFKHADITPVHKKKEKSYKINYRPVSIISNLSKIYVKLIYNQLRDYFDKILFPSQCGFPALPASNVREP